MVANSSSAGDDESTQAIGGIYEMKNAKKKNSSKQLCANMIHFGAQLTVKPLGEGDIIHRTITYGVTADYEKNRGSLATSNDNGL